MPPSTPPLTYRVATPEDAPHLTRIINAAFRTEKTGDTWLYDDQDKRVDIQTVEEIRSVITSPETDMLVGSLQSGDSPGERVTTCYVRRPSSDREKYPHVTPGSAWLGFLAVSPSHHFKGYGKAMLFEAERFVKEDWGVHRLEIDFMHTRVELNEWYRRQGYKETGASRPFPYAEGAKAILRDGLSLIVLGKDLK